MRVFYMGLERIEARYTHQLEDWNRAAFDKAGVEFIPVYGTVLGNIGDKIVTGSVLDAHGRTHWSLTQMANLVDLLQKGELTNRDVIFFEDMFTPGFESLGYIFKQTPKQFCPRVFVRCLAQTIDPDDFVHRTGMFKFMRRYEQMVDSIVDGILVASSEMTAHLRIAGFEAPIYYTGLPFGKEEVQSRVPDVPSYFERPRQIAYAARWDEEKQPDFFMDLVETTVRADPSVKFVVLNGNAELKSSQSWLVHRAKGLAALLPNNFKVLNGLTKNEYYKHLSQSRVLFNCALQDWVSNTVSEADALGCQTLYPAYRSFPEVFANNPDHMYIPWSLKDASSKLLHLIDNQVQTLGKVSDHQNGTIARTIEVLKGTAYPEDDRLYRQEVRVPKYDYDTEL